MLGIIGGSGLACLGTLAVRDRETLSTPYGAPSAALVYGMLQHREVVFLARHGEGHTLAAIRRKILEAGAESFYSAVFADKNIGSDKPVAADFVGVRLPNRYVFGFGMDVHGLWRNLPAVYALREKQ